MNLPFRKISQEMFNFWAGVVVGAGLCAVTVLLFKWLL